MDSTHLLHVCHTKALEGLRANISEHGILAASSASTEGKAKNYAALYTRDIGITSYALLTAKQEEFYEAIKRSLISLTRAQSPLGQFPFYYKPEEEKIQWRDMGSLDSTIWWCITFLLYHQTTNDESFFKDYFSHFEKAMTWLLYQDVNHDSLLEQQEASDWADEMPRHGMVLYSNSLWYWLLDLFEESKISSNLHTRVLEALPSSAQVKEAINTLFWIHKTKDTNLTYIPDNDYTKNNLFSKGLLENINSKVVYLPYYLSYVAHKNFEARCDSLANILTGLFGIADSEKTSLIIDSMIRSGMNHPFPVKALYPVIYPGEADWKDYMAKGRQNYPNQYHNGGSWPFIGGFWIQLLSKRDKRLAHEELVKLAKANSLNNFEFNEYLHGELGTPMGVPHQTWSMAMYIVAYHSVYSQSRSEDTLYTSSFQLQKVDEEPTIQ